MKPLTPPTIAEIFAEARMDRAASYQAKYDAMAPEEREILYASMREEECSFNDTDYSDQRATYNQLAGLL